MKPRSVAALNIDELEKLSTKRLLAYLGKLHSCEEDISLSDFSEEEINQTEGVIFKSSSEWKSLYESTKAILATRPHVKS